MGSRLQRWAFSIQGLLQCLHRSAFLTDNRRVPRTIAHGTSHHRRDDSNRKQVALADDVTENDDEIDQGNANLRLPQIRWHFAERGQHMVRLTAGPSVAAKRHSIASSTRTQSGHIRSQLRAALKISQDASLTSYKIATSKSLTSAKHPRGTELLVQQYFYRQFHRIKSVPFGANFRTNCRFVDNCVNAFSGRNCDAI